MKFYPKSMPRDGLLYSGKKHHAIYLRSKPEWLSDAIGHARRSHNFHGSSPAHSTLGAFHPKCFRLG